MRPSETDYGPWYASYVARVMEDDILGTMERQAAETQSLLGTIDDARAAHRYADDKWSIRQVFGHLGDAECVFGYRALAISRGDQTPLPGFDENDYVRTAEFDRWPIRDLAEALAVSRRANLLRFRSMTGEQWTRAGIASGNRVTVNALAYIIVGHERHHLAVLRERYGL